MHLGASPAPRVQSKTPSCVHSSWMLGLLWLFVLAVTVTASVSAQQIIHVAANVGAPQAAQAAIPEFVLYHQFFRHFLFFDHQIELHRQQAQSNAKIIAEEPNPYQKKLNLDTAQVQAVRSAATKTEEQVAALDVQARKIVLAFRAANPKTSPNSPLPAVPQELTTLQQQRDALIQTEVSQLRSSLSGDGAQRLDTYLKTQFAPHVRVTLVGPPRSHDPAAKPLAPFERIR